MFSFLLNNVWIAIGLWTFLYLMDYLLTLKAARMYQAGVNQHIRFGGGYELNPVFREDIALLRRFSFRFWLLLILVDGLLLILYALGIPEIFAVVWGMFIGIQIAVHFRHLRNLVVFHHARQSQGIKGQIAYEHWFSLRLSAVDLLSFGFLFTLLFLFSGNFVMLGSAAGCLVMALRHLFDSIKARKTSLQI